MAIQFITIKCPECSADLQIEDGRDYAFCSYCGAKVMIANDNEHIYRTIDEAGIKHAETERMIRLRELELEAKETEKSRLSKYIAYGVALLCVIVGAIICIWAPLGGMWGIIIGAYIAMFTMINSDDKKKKKKKYTGSDDVEITTPMMDCVDYHFNKAVQLYKNAGFININAIPLHDLTRFNQKKDGMVESITINGNDEFEEEEVYPKNANILITYHSK